MSSSSKISSSSSSADAEMSSVELLLLPVDATAVPRGVVVVRGSAGGGDKSKMTTAARNIQSRGILPVAMLGHDIAPKKRTKNGLGRLENARLLVRQPLPYKGEKNSRRFLQNAARSSVRPSLHYTPSWSSPKILSS